MIEDLVSIVMPVYNVEKYISTAIESVIVQDYENWELIIVDDGSIDKSIEIASSYTLKDKRIKILHKTNGGLSDARNFGLENCKGEYVHFFDSDDFIVSNFYSQLINSFSENTDFVICGYYRDIETKEGILSKEMKCPRLISYELNKQMSYRELLVSHFNYAWNKIFRTDFLLSNNLRYQKGLSIIEDKEFMLRVIKHNPTFIFIDFLGYHYQVRKRFTLNNTVTNDFVECNKLGIVIQKEILTHFCNNQSILNYDGGIVAYEGIRWTIYCLFNTSLSLSMKTKKQYIDSMLCSDYLQHQLLFYKPTSLRDRIMKSLLRIPLSNMICVIYSALRFLNR